MKVLTVIILLICSCQASAGLITFQSDQASYAENDIVTIDVNINDINPMIDFVELDIGFDPLALEFVEDSWLDTSDVFDFGAFGDAFLFTNDTLILQASFLDSITDVLGTSFKLGELQVSALTDLATTSFSSKLVTNKLGLMSKRFSDSTFSFAVRTLSLFFISMRNTCRSNIFYFL